MPDDLFMRSFRRAFALLVLGSALLCLLSGCAAPPAPDFSSLKPPAVRLGPVLVILPVETGEDIVRTVPAPDGQLHVLIASAKLKQVLDVVVRDVEVAQPVVIRTNVSPASIDGAFDREGRLHVLIDLEHWIMEEGAWHVSDRTPWADAGLKARRAWFVRGGPELVWAFVLAGSDVDAPIRMEIWGIGGAGAGIIWPWFTRGVRTVLVEERAPECNVWNVLHQKGYSDTEPIGLAADLEGNIHVFYRGSYIFLAEDIRYYYARINARDLQPAALYSPSPAMSRGAEIRLREVMGIPLKGLATAPTYYIPQNFALNPETGMALIGMRFLIQGDKFTTAFETPQPLLNIIDNSRVAPAGKDSFHAVYLGDIQEAGASVEYMMFSGLEWSAPLRLGFFQFSTIELPELLKQIFTDYTRATSIRRESLDLVSAVNGRAFVTWPTAHGIVGRWVARDEAKTPTTDKGDLATWQPIKEGIEKQWSPPEWSIHIKPDATPRDPGLPRQAKVQLADLRKETGFQRTAAFGVSMGRISLDRTVPELVSIMIGTKSDETLARQGGSQPEEITCEIRAFEIATPGTLLYWDVNTRIELLLRVRGQEREVSATATERTYIWPSEKLITRVVNEALRQAEEESELALQELLALPPDRSDQE
jgi:hypothetical protein